MSSLSSALPENARSLPILKPLDASLGQRFIMLDRPVCVVGARSRVHLPLPSQLVSKAHALLVSDDDGVYVRDLASRNHVFRNGETVRESSLKQADLLRIGPFSFYCQFNFSRRRSESDSRLPPPADLISERTGERRRLDERTLLIGQRAECDMVVRGADVSSVHAIVFRRRGRHYLRDLNSEVGTRLNGRIIREAELQNGDGLEIGSERFQYLVDAPADEHAGLDELGGPPHSVSDGDLSDLASASSLGIGIEMHDHLGSMPSFGQIGRLERTDASLGIEDSGQFGGTQQFGETQHYSFPEDAPAPFNAELAEHAEPQDLLPDEQWMPKGDAAADFLTTSGLHELSNANGWTPAARPPVELSVSDLSGVEFSEPASPDEQSSAAERSSAGDLDPVIFDHVSHVLDEAAVAEAAHPLTDEPAPVDAANLPLSLPEAELSFMAAEELLPPEEASSSLRLHDAAADSAASGHLMMIDDAELANEAPTPFLDPPSASGSIDTVNYTATPSVRDRISLDGPDDDLDDAILGRVEHGLDEPMAPSPELPPTPRVEKPALPVRAKSAAPVAKASPPPTSQRSQPRAAQASVPASRPKPKRTPPKRSTKQEAGDSKELFSDEIAAAIQAELASPNKAKAPQRVSARPMVSGPEHPALIAAVQSARPQSAWDRFRQKMGGLFGRRK